MNPLWFYMCIVVVAAETKISSYNFLAKFLALTEAELQETERVATQCLNVNNLNPELISKAERGIFPDNRDLKCFYGCYLEDYGLIDAAGKISVAKIETKAPEPVIKLAKWCLEQVHYNKDLCELAYKTYMCFVLEGRKQAQQRT